MKLTTQPPAFASQVRHIGPDDALSSVAIYNVTKALASNDEVLSKALSALLAELKSIDLQSPLVLPRITLQAQGRTVICNFRIPAGYTATVLNASVASTPSTGLVALKVLHSRNTFGQDGSGAGVTELVTTTSEKTVTANYVSSGEFIVVLESSATSRQDVASSVIITLRPV